MFASRSRSAHIGIHVGYEHLLFTINIVSCTALKHLYRISVVNPWCRAQHLLKNRVVGRCQAPKLSSYYSEFIQALVIYIISVLAA
jgi:hypothetical protein